MRRRRFIPAFALLAGLVLLSGAAIALAQAAVPALQGRVNDYAGLLDAGQREQLEQALAAFERDTTTQIVLLTVPSLEGEDIEGFSMRVAEAWKIGQKSKNNGVLLIVAPNDHKVRIEVGYGLEGPLTDAQSARIIREVIAPAFRDGNFYAGIAGGLNAIMRATRGEFTAPANAVGPGGVKELTCRQMLSLLAGLIVLILLLSTRTGRFILFTMMLSGRSSGGRGGFSGGFSGGGGGFGGGGASGSW